jgi:hypothetical protein
MYEITEENSVIYYCDSCRLACMHGKLREHATALCIVNTCTFCAEKKLVNVYKYGNKTVFIPLDEHGVAKDTHVEREGV